MVKIIITSRNFDILSDCIRTKSCCEFQSVLTGGVERAVLFWRGVRWVGD
ncbi:hypothetical protein [Archaeoglobus sp.]